MTLEKGKGTSEFLVVMLIIVPWVCNSLGVDPQQLFHLLAALGWVDLSQVALDSGQLRETIATANQSSTPVLVGLAYVVGRPIQKVVVKYLHHRFTNDHSSPSA